MILYVTISDQQSEWVIPKAPIVESVSANIKSIRVIYNYLRGVNDRVWLDRATKEATGEMWSDKDQLIKEAKEAIRSARKQIPLRYNIILPIILWLQKLK